MGVPARTSISVTQRAVCRAESIAIPLSVFVAAEVFVPNFGYHGIFAMLAVSIVVALVLLVRFVHMPPIYSSS